MKKLWRKKLALLLASATHVKPYYCEVEYLESKNQQTDDGSTNAAAYIDTGIIPNNNTRIECRMQFTTLISGQSKEALNGTTGAESAPRFAWGFASVSPYTNFYFGLGAQNLTTSVTRDTNVHTFVLDAKNKTCSIDNTTQSFTSSGSLNSTRSIYLFARHATQNYANKPCNAKIYRHRNWDNDQLVQDLIPVLDRNMTPCMYDRVSGELLYNKGTGTFSYGRQIHPVEYLESTGTQYIDTGHAFTDDFSWEIDFEGLTKGATLFGGRTSSTRTALLYQKSSVQGVETACPIAGMTGDQTPFQLSDLSSNRHKVKMSVSSNKGSVWVDGTQVYNNQSFSGTYISGTTQALFADNFGTSVSEYTSSKVYGLKMWQGSVIVRDYIPAKDENDVGFMFDRVSHTISDNAGSGSFITGNVVD